MRIAVFGIRSIPLCAGCAGADKIILEFFKRLVKRNFHAVAYNRVYSHNKKEVKLTNHCGIDLIYLNTVDKKGFDTFIHSAKAVFHIIYENTADIVIISNGGNSIWASLLRIFGKKTIMMMDGMDWKRDKWPWYGKLYLYFSIYFTAVFPNIVIFDNVFTKEIYEKKFKKKFHLIKNGVDVSEFHDDKKVLKDLQLIKGEYILFVGRFIPDKGLHYLIPAFEEVKTSKKLVLVGGSPNPSKYEKNLYKTKDTRIIFPGFIYGNDMWNLIKNAYLYIQPSDVEGLSPIIQEVMALGTPLLCSDIQENLFVVGDTAITFRKSNMEDLRDKIIFAFENPNTLNKLAIIAKEKILKDYSWNTSTDKLEEFIKLL